MRVLFSGAIAEGLATGRHSAAPAADTTGAYDDDVDRDAGRAEIEQEEDDGNDDGGGGGGLFGTLFGEDEED